MCISSHASEVLLRVFRMIRRKSLHPTDIPLTGIRHKSPIRSAVHQWPEKRRMAIEDYMTPSRSKALHDSHNRKRPSPKERPFHSLQLCFACLSTAPETPVPLDSRTTMHRASRSSVPMA